MIYVSFLLTVCTSLINWHNVILRAFFSCVFKVCNLWCGTRLTVIHPVTHVTAGELGGNIGEQEKRLVSLHLY